MEHGGLLLMLCAGFAVAQDEPYVGRTIREVRYVPAEQPLTSADLAKLNALAPGQPLRSADAAATIDRLFATGRYNDIQIDAAPAGESEVVVSILTTNQFFVGHIAIVGDVGQSPTPSELIDATRLRLGEPLQEDDVRGAEENLHRVLNRNGLYEHTIHVEFDDRADIQQRDLRFLVDTGPRAKYTDPVILGHPELSDNTITRASGWRWRFIHLWRKVTQERTNKGIVGVRRKYQDEGFLMADITRRPLQYDPDTRRAQPTLEIEAGPKVEVRAVEADVSQRVLKRYVPIFQELAVDRDLLVAGATNLRDYFQSKGYFEAEVDFRQRELDPAHLMIEYVVSLGKRSKLARVEIEGNRFFNTEDLRERMFLQESGLLRLRHGRYSETFLDRDRESIVNLYRANGFRDVQVEASVQDNYQGHPEDVVVRLRIDEGPVWRVRSVALNGVTNLDSDDLRSRLSSIAGQAYSEVNVAIDRSTILTRYQAEGFPDATFQWSATPDPDAHEMDMVYDVTEGRRQVVRDVVLSGIELTRLRLVHRQITMRPGDPLSLVEMSEAQRRLYQLGIFARIDMAVQNQAGSTESKHVLYDFHEASRYSLAVGGGAEFARIGGTTSDLSSPEGAAGFSPRVSVDLTRLNFLGLGHSISLRGRVSNLEQVGSVNYLAPRFRNMEGRNITFTTTYQVQRDVRTFSSRREEGAIQITQQLSKPTNVLFRFAYRRVSANNVVIPRLLIPQLLQPVRIGILSGNYVQDRRDNPADATRGIYNTVDIGVASGAFGSQRSFIRALGRNSTYHEIARNVVLARETSFGVVFPFHVPAGVDRADAIPLPERFYGGGSATHRGFPSNQAGPRDTGVAGSGQVAQATGFPLGGNALFFNKIELRFPLIGDNIGGVLFHDAGNIYDNIGNLSFRTTQRSDADFNYMVHAAGFGLRYKTPVGPVRVDLAYSINPPRYLGFEGTTRDLLNCGAPGTPTECDVAQRRISHFQFFFSIGQTF